LTETWFVQKCPLDCHRAERRPCVRNDALLLSRARLASTRCCITGSHHKYIRAILMVRWVNCVIHAIHPTRRMYNSTTNSTVCASWHWLHSRETVRRANQPGAVIRPCSRPRSASPRAHAPTAPTAILHTIAIAMKTHARNVRGCYFNASTSRQVMAADGPCK
jgi:hypothetical protein